MTVTASKIVTNRLQADGSCRIREEHTLSDGEQFYVNYKASPVADVNQIMLDRVAGINEAIIEAEELRCLRRDDLETYVPVHTTKDAIIKRVLNYFLSTEGTENVHLIPFINTLSQVQIEAHISNTWYQVLRTRINAITAMNTTYQADKAKIKVS